MQRHLKVRDLDLVLDERSTRFPDHVRLGQTRNPDRVVSVSASTRRRHCSSLFQAPYPVLPWPSSSPCSRRPNRRCAPRSAKRGGATRLLPSQRSSPPPRWRPAQTSASRRPVAASSPPFAANALDKGGLDAFIHEYALSSREGVALMCLAEALLRIPDTGTIDRLIRDKLAAADWESHLGHSGSLFVNASTWALMLTGRLLRDDPTEPDLGGALRRFAARSASPWCARRCWPRCASLDASS